MSAAKTIAGGLAAGRLAIGVGLWVAPRATARVLGFDRFDERALVLGRVAATRDLVLGAWQAASVGDPASLRSVARAGVVADAGDAIAFGLAAAAGERRVGMRGLAAAVPATAFGVWLALHA